jgi:hypothetical protein
MLEKQINGFIEYCKVSGFRDKSRVNRNRCGKMTLFLPFLRFFTGGYIKIKKCHFFLLLIPSLKD